MFKVDCPVCKSPEAVEVMLDPSWQFMVCPKCGKHLVGHRWYDGSDKVQIVLGLDVKYYEPPRFGLIGWFHRWLRR